MSTKAKTEIDLIGSVGGLTDFANPTGGLGRHPSIGVVFACRPRCIGRARVPSCGAATDPSMSEGLTWEQLT